MTNYQQFQIVFSAYIYQVGDAEGVGCEAAYDYSLGYWI